MTCAALSSTVLHMPRKGYRAVSLEDTARIYLGDVRRKASQLLGRDLTLSDAAGIASIMTLNCSAEQVRVALDVFIEFRDNARSNT